MTAPVISLSVERAKRDARLAPCPTPIEFFLAGMIAGDAFYRLAYMNTLAYLDSLCRKAP